MPKRGKARIGFHSKWTGILTTAITDAGRDRIVEEDYGLLIDDLVSLDRSRQTPILLIKANICRLLDGRLTNDGFNVLNKGRVVYFPASGQQSKFRKEVQEVLAEHPDLLP